MVAAAVWQHEMISTLVRIVMHMFDEANFIVQLTKWEFDIPEYERVTGD